MDSINAPSFGWKYSLPLWSLGHLLGVSFYPVLGEAIDTADAVCVDSEADKEAVNEMTLASTPLSIALLIGFILFDFFRLL